MALESLLVYESDTGSSSDEEGCEESLREITCCGQARMPRSDPSPNINKISVSVPTKTESVSKSPGSTIASNGSKSSPQNEKKLHSCQLPLPESVRNMFSDAVSGEPRDTPGEHGGKIRSFAHEQGVWATYVYIEYDPDLEFLELVEELVNIAERHGLSLSQNEGFHISLSRTLKLRHHWIQPFVEALKVQLIIFQRFKVMLQSVEVYVNEENTRTFLGLKVHYGAERLEKVVKRVNKCLEEFKLPSFHQDPSFHLSVAYSVGNIKEKLQSILPDLNIAFQTFAETHPQCRTIWVSNMCCKSGNKFFNVPFKS